MLGFEIRAVQARVPAAIVERFRELPVANVSDSMARMAAGGHTLRPYHGGGVLAGPAITIKTRPGDNLVVHKALDIAEPGDVIVVDAGGDLTNAIVGELMIAYAIHRGIGGMVINGAVRDVAAIRSGSFPVYAAGVTHRGPYKDGPGAVNVPITLGGMVIEPGDLILGDDDGVVAVPLAMAADVCEAAAAKHAQEQETIGKIMRGETDRSWIDRELKQRGCTF